MPGQLELKNDPNSLLRRVVTLAFDLPMIGCPIESQCIWFHARLSVLDTSCAGAMLPLGRRQRTFFGNMFIVHINFGGLVLHGLVMRVGTLMRAGAAILKDLNVGISPLRFFRKSRFQEVRFGHRVTV